MSETYEIYIPNGWLLDIDKKQIKYILQMMIQVPTNIQNNIPKPFQNLGIQIESSPYKSYKSIILDSNIKLDETSNYLEYRKQKDIYLKDPPKGDIALWTKAEKAYYESLKRKR